MHEALLNITVTPEKALSLVTYQACVSLIAESVAQLPCELYQKKGDQRDRAIDHPVYSPGARTAERLADGLRVHRAVTGLVWDARQQLLIH
ncbi:hypothetical protein [Paludibacterium denitrificans]|uniref:hypothetical protein n=1 Tax=Paludibacterium denitrificans TaxID=2675226 RepID=UPI001E42FC1F|nr:hypothetical protein [Paludibacterium denitrificans]